MLYDGHGSTSVLLLDGSTVTVAGTGVNRQVFDYDAYGNFDGFTGTAIATLLYSGEQREAKTGLYYLRARYYDAATGRFTTSDPANGNTERSDQPA